MSITNTWFDPTNATRCENGCEPGASARSSITRSRFTSSLHIAGESNMERICVSIRRSLRYGLSHHEEVLAAVSRYGRGPEGQCTNLFVSMFANQDSLRMSADVRRGLKALFAQAAALDLAPAAPRLDIVKGVAPSTSSLA